ncbi:formylmethanofuran--tetrahydromethanopterin N-formyltransferase [Candidatus Bathyarchaeota archaeon]|nr:formylmethanofuran--tetrahydromethanopterin N-formyltransferase [Candidatus Bathyarchaeota archaeon]
MQFNGVEVEETFAEAFPMVVGRILVTAANPNWAMIAGKTATGFASSIIMSPAEAAIEGGMVPPERTPDGRPGVFIQMWHRSRRELKVQMITRIGQCILTCPTTAAFDALPDAVRRLKVGLALRKFGDGFQKRDKLGDRNVWRIPVMEGEFIIEDRFGVKKGVAGGNFIIMADSQPSALEAAEKAVEAMVAVEGVVLPFPGGICRSGSKVGSMKYKLPASTNHPFCPTLRTSISDSKVPATVQSVYELVFNGLDEEIVKKATGVGIVAAAKTPGVVKITAVNFGGKLGPYQIQLVDALKSAS